MIRHVVMWRMGAEAVAEIAQGFRALEGRIPGARSIRVDIGDRRVEGNAALMLTIDLGDWSDLAAYYAHPAHVEIAAKVRAVATDRMALDFDLGEV